MCTLLAPAVAVCVVLVGTDLSEHDLVLHRGRGTTSRLDSHEAILHAHEVTEPDAAPIARVLITPAPVGSALGTDRARPRRSHALVWLETPVLQSAPLVPTPAIRATTRSGVSLPTRGRAPPHV